jgi:hypothetical protein
MADARPPRRWLPLLPESAVAPDGLAERVNRALDDIAKALAQPAPEIFAPGSHRLRDLADGPAGVALFFHYLDQARPGTGHDDQALAHLEAAIEATSAATSDPSLYTGFTGVAWTVEHLTGRLLEPPASGGLDAGAEVARVLTSYLRRRPRHDSYDLFGGLAGLGVWALERAPRAGAAEAAESVVRHLGEIAERRAGGFTWRTPPAQLVPAARATYPRGCYKLGVAHGVAGVIGVLGGLRSAGMEAGGAPELLAGAVEWLLGQMLPPGASSWPDAVAPGVEPLLPARLAWCRGDAGIALSLLAAARVAGEPEWERRALGVARAAAARPRDAARASDGGLCHGAAGLAHLYNRLFHATGEDLFAAEAIAWIERLLAQRRPGRGLAGWLSWQAIRELAEFDVELGWLPVSGLLTGIAGIGLTLLGAVSPVEPAWDRLLLCSVPPIAELEELDASRDAPADAHPCSWPLPRPPHLGDIPEKGDRE